MKCYYQTWLNRSFKTAAALRTLTIYLFYVFKSIYLTLSTIKYRIFNVNPVHTETHYAMMREWWVRIGMMMTIACVFHAGWWWATMCGYVEPRWLVCGVSYVLFEFDVSARFCPAADGKYHRLRQITERWLHLWSNRAHERCAFFGVGDELNVLSFNRWRAQDDMILRSPVGQLYLYSFTHTHKEEKCD